MRKAVMEDFVPAQMASAKQAAGRVSDRAAGRELDQAAGRVSDQAAGRVSGHAAPRVSDRVGHCLSTVRYCGPCLLSRFLVAR